MKKFEQLAKNFGKACFMTEDGQIFEHSYEGLNRAKSHGKRGRYMEFDADGKFVEQLDPEEEKAALVKAISADPANKYNEPQLLNLALDGLRRLKFDLAVETEAKQGENTADNDDDDVFNIDKAKKDELVEFLIELDPRLDEVALNKLKKDQLKDAIQDANTLTGETYTEEALADLVHLFNEAHASIEDAEEDALFDADITAEQMAKVFTVDELRDLVLYMRDEVELDAEIMDKATQLEADVEE